MALVKTPDVVRLPRTRLDLLDSLPKHSVVAELGVFIGEFSSQILSRCHPKHLYLVDLFRGEITSGDQNGQNMRTVVMDDMRWNLEVKFGGKPVSVVAADSIGWLLERNHSTLDWCYIDTSHEYERTAGELIAARGAVRDGGWICGHDYHRIFSGVIQAVDHFCLYHHLTLELFEGDKLPSYRILNRKSHHDDFGGMAAM